MADLAHRLDWWNVRDEHTQFEWAMQRARFEVEPWGDDRADHRLANSVLKLLLKDAGPNPDPDLVTEVADQLQFYLKSNQPPDVMLTPAQAQALHGR